MADLGPLLGIQPTGYTRGLFAAQRRFVRDRSKRKAGLCGRRAGKTETLAPWLYDSCVRRPGSINAYIALSQKSARRILWPTLKRVAARYELPLDFREQTLTATHPNGSCIWVAGCPDESQCEDFRGPRYGRIAIDEAGSFPPWLEYLVTDVLDPALMDIGGELAMVGSPGLIPMGFFYDKTTLPLDEGGWSTHSWTCLDNPHVPGAAYLAEKTKEHGWQDDHPTLVREYLGRWVRDDSAFIYPFDARKNAGLLEQRDDARPFRVLSVDLGMVDNTALVLSASHRGSPELFIERAWYARKPTGPLTVAYVAAQIEQARQSTRIDAIVVDEGGLGKMVVSDFQTTYGIPCIPAEKRDKLAAIHGLRGALLAGTVKVDPQHCQPLIGEWSALAWNEDRDDHAEACVDDLSDAALYGWRAHGLFYNPELNPPKPGTREAHLAATVARKVELSRRIEKRNRRGWTIR